MVGDLLFFRADDGINGAELWVTDGTSSGTRLVKDIRTGIPNSAPRFMVNLGGTLLFNADDGVSGRELWRSDGTAAGTVLVRDIWAGPLPATATFLQTGPFLLPEAVSGSTLFFSVDDGVNGRELWKTDGTTAGTVLVRDINPLGDSSPGELSALDGKLVFNAVTPATGRELWTSDGTEAGTVMSPEIVPGTGSSSPRFMFYVPSLRQMFFQATSPATGAELWSAYRNEPPDCSASFVTPDALWPPNHKMASVEVVGVTDPDGDPVEVTITDVFSDEPISGLFPYDPSPDAELLWGPAKLRKERYDAGNGRVYTVSHAATDMPFGATCEGVATVCVPHDLGNPACGDEGPLYDATQP